MNNAVKHASPRIDGGNISSSIQNIGVKNTHQPAATIKLSQQSALWYGFSFHAPSIGVFRYGRIPLELSVLMKTI